MLKSILIFTTLIASVHTYAQDNKICGTWLTSDKDATIEIYKDKGTFSGKTIWLKQSVDPSTGAPWMDAENPSPEKRNQPLIGSLTLWGFIFAGNEYNKGKVYDSRDGKTYSGKMWLTDPDHLKMRGYWGVFYKTEIWTRVK